MQHKHRFQLSSSLKPKRALAYLGGVSLLALSTMSAHADPTLSELAAELRELKASNAQMRAENRQMKAAISEMRGTRLRTRGPSHDYAERTTPAAPLPAGGAIPVMVTPDKRLQLGGITITPGGFLAGESVFRSRTTNSDINSAWGSIPLNNNPLSRTNEYRLTGRQSRLALLAEGAITPSMIASGYAEFDFLGAGTTSNATDTNSYAPRIRQLYAGLDLTDYGVHMLAGQMWSLTTLNSKGITPRNEVLPATIDGQFLPGTIFARQAAVRLTKDFDRKLWLSLALEEAQTTFPGGLTAACQGTAITDAAGASPVTVVGNGTTGLPANISSICAATASGAGFSQYGQPYSLNHLPDVIGKVAYEAKFANRDVHIEGMGLYKDLYNASYQTGTLGSLQTHDVAGYGFGGGAIVPLLPRTLDFEIQAMAGRGIGRYGAGLLPDSTISADGSLKPIGEVIGLAGLTLHATPAIDFYALAGVEREDRAFSSYTNAAGGVTNVGYGVPDASNFGCGVLNAPSTTTCSGQTQQLWQLSGGFWDKVYKGSFGEVRVGAQYSYTQRDVFGTTASAANATANAAAAGLTVAQASHYYSPKAAESTVMTSLRYYPFQ